MSSIPNIEVVEVEGVQYQVDIVDLADGHRQVYINNHPMLRRDQFPLGVLQGICSSLTGRPVPKSATKTAMHNLLTERSQPKQGVHHSHANVGPVKAEAVAEAVADSVAKADTPSPSLGKSTHDKSTFVTPKRGKTGQPASSPPAAAATHLPPHDPPSDSLFDNPSRHHDDTADYPAPLPHVAKSAATPPPRAPTTALQQPLNMQGDYTTTTPQPSHPTGTTTAAVSPEAPHPGFAGLTPFLHPVWDPHELGSACDLPEMGTRWFDPLQNVTQNYAECRPDDYFALSPDKESFRIETPHLFPTQLEPINEAPIHQNGYVSLLLDDFSVDRIFYLFGNRPLGSLRLRQPHWKKMVVWRKPMHAVLRQFRLQHIQEAIRHAELPPSVQKRLRAFKKDPQTILSVQDCVRLYSFQFSRGVLVVRNQAPMGSCDRFVHWQKSALYPYRVIAVWDRPIYRGCPFLIFQHQRSTSPGGGDLITTADFWLPPVRQGTEGVARSSGSGLPVDAAGRYVPIYEMQFYNCPQLKLGNLPRGFRFKANPAVINPRAILPTHYPNHIIPEQNLKTSFSLVRAILTARLLHHEVAGTKLTAWTQLIISVSNMMHQNLAALYPELHVRVGDPLSSWYIKAMASVLSRMFHVKLVIVEVEAANHPPHTVFCAVPSDRWDWPVCMVGMRRPPMGERPEFYCGIEDRGPAPTATTESVRSAAPPILLDRQTPFGNLPPQNLLANHIEANVDSSYVATTLITELAHTFCPVDAQLKSSVHLYTSLTNHPSRKNAIESDRYSVPIYTQRPGKAHPLSLGHNYRLQPDVGNGYSQPRKVSLFRFPTLQWGEILVGSVLYTLVITLVDPGHSPKYETLAEKGPATPWDEDDIAGLEEILLRVMKRRDDIFSGGEASLQAGYMTLPPKRSQPRRYKSTGATVFNRFTPTMFREFCSALNQECQKIVSGESPSDMVKPSTRLVACYLLKCCIFLAYAAGIKDIATVASFVPPPDEAPPTEGAKVVEEHSAQIFEGAYNLVATQLIPNPNTQALKGFDFGYNTQPSHHHDSLIVMHEDGKEKVAQNLKDNQALASHYTSQFRTGIPPPPSLKEIIELGGDTVKGALPGLAISVRTKAGATGTVVEVGETGVRVQFLAPENGNNHLSFVAWEDAVFDVFSENVRRKYRWFLPAGGLREGLAWLDGPHLCYTTLVEQEQEEEEPTQTFQRVMYNRSTQHVCPLGWVDSTVAKSQILQTGANWCPNPQWTLSASNIEAAAAANDYLEGEHPESDGEPADNNNLKDDPPLLGYPPSITNLPNRCVRCDYLFQLATPWVCPECRSWLCTAFPTTRVLDGGAMGTCGVAMLQFMFSSSHFLLALEMSPPPTVECSKGLSFLKGVLGRMSVGTGPVLVEELTPPPGRNADAKSMHCHLPTLPQGLSLAEVHLTGGPGPHRVCFETANPDSGPSTARKQCVVFRIHREQCGDEDWAFDEQLSRPGAASETEGSPHSYTLQAIVLAHSVDRCTYHVTVARRAHHASDASPAWVMFDRHHCRRLPAVFNEWAATPHMTRKVVLLLYDAQDQLVAGGGSRTTSTKSTTGGAYPPVHHRERNRHMHVRPPIGEDNYAPNLEAADFDEDYTPPPEVAEELDGRLSTEGARSLSLTAYVDGHSWLDLLGDQLGSHKFPAPLAQVRAYPYLGNERTCAFGTGSNVLIPLEICWQPEQDAPPEEEGRPPELLDRLVGGYLSVVHPPAGPTGISQYSPEVKRAQQVMQYYPILNQLSHNVYSLLLYSQQLAPPELHRLAEECCQAVQALGDTLDNLEAAYAKGLTQRVEYNWVLPSPQNLQSPCKLFKMLNVMDTCKVVEGRELQTGYLSRLRSLASPLHNFAGYIQSTPANAAPMESNHLVARIGEIPITTGQTLFAHVELLRMLLTEQHMVSKYQTDVLRPYMGWNERSYCPHLAPQYVGPPEHAPWANLFGIVETLLLPLQPEVRHHLQDRIRKLYRYKLRKGKGGHRPLQQTVTIANFRADYLKWDERLDGLVAEFFGQAENPDQPLPQSPTPHRLARLLQQQPASIHNLAAQISWLMTSLYDLCLEAYYYDYETLLSNWGTPFGAHAPSHPCFHSLAALREIAGRNKEELSGAPGGCRVVVSQGNSMASDEVRNLGIRKENATTGMYLDPDGGPAQLAEAMFGTPKKLVDIQKEAIVLPSSRLWNQVAALWAATTQHCKNSPVNHVCAAHLFNSTNLHYHFQVSFQGGRGRDWIVHHPGNVFQPSTMVLVESQPAQMRLVLPQNDWVSNLLQICLKFLEGPADTLTPWLTVDIPPPLLPLKHPIKFSFPPGSKDTFDDAITSQHWKDRYGVSPLKAFLMNVLDHKLLHPHDTAVKATLWQTTIPDDLDLRFSLQELKKKPGSGDIRTWRSGLQSPVTKSQFLVPLTDHTTTYREMFVAHEKHTLRADTGRRQKVTLEHENLVWKYMVSQFTPMALIMWRWCRKQYLEAATPGPQRNSRPATNGALSNYSCQALELCYQNAPFFDPQFMKYIPPTKTERLARTKSGGEAPPAHLAQHTNPPKHNTTPSHKRRHSSGGSRMRKKAKSRLERKGPPPTHPRENPSGPQRQLRPSPLARPHRSSPRPRIASPASAHATHHATHHQTPLHPRIRDNPHPFLQLNSQISPPPHTPSPAPHAQTPHTAIPGIQPSPIVRPDSSRRTGHGAILRSPLTE